ncbi:MAG TPA: zf-HC2 domain-containing protein [Tepidisphaeraceae bacterium]|jgi:hypothetical protein|nr:zf-HC2 domain-containing protein [Tepidisphaeraceae bacterium]
MAENVEDIEGKLAAFVDGELTPEERVEIETHLQNNPSHRELLADLVVHRNLVRGLPREKAPGDCTEGFQGQLERDILLGGDELTRSRSRFRISYSPQLLSAAAIILLAVGLAIVVYSVLPPHHPKAPIAQLATEPSKNTELTPESSGSLADARSFKGGPLEVAAKKSAGESTLALRQEVVGQKPDSTRYAGFKAQAQEPIAAGDMMVITVTAEDVKSANEAAVSYLALNNIYFTAPSAEGVWKDGVEALYAGRRLAASTNGAGLSGGGAGFGGGVSVETGVAAQAPALQDALNQVAKREESLVRAREEAPRPDAKTALKDAPQESKTLPEQNAVALRDDPQGEQRFAKMAARPTPARPDGGASPATQPSAVALGTIDPRGVNDEVKAKNGRVGGGQGVAGGAVLSRQQQLRAQLTDQDGEGARVILARNMNDQQVRDLARSLSQPERNQWATVRRDVSDEYRRNALAVLEGSDQKEHLLTYQVAVQENEVMLRGKLAANAPAVVAPTTRPAEVVALNIKPAEAGLTREVEAQNRVTGTLLGKGVPSDFAYVEPAQQAPGQQQAFAISPTTQPIAARRAETFNCVIVFENATTAKAAGTATQPVAGKPSTAPTAAPPAAEQAK